MREPAANVVLLWHLRCCQERGYIDTYGVREQGVYKQKVRNRSGEGQLSGGD